MKHLEILGHYKDYNYVYYEVNDKLTYEYERMKYLVLNQTRGMADPHPLEAGILLEKDDEIIAGTFLNLSLADKILLILNIYVDEPHRRNGIHTTMHTFIDKIAISKNKTGIYSNIHASNKIMMEHVAKKQGYETVVQTVRRSVKEKGPEGPL